MLLVMVNRRAYLRFFLVFVVVVWFANRSIMYGNEAKKNVRMAEPVLSVHVGVVLDLNTTVGATADVSMSMALGDFYALHPNYKTRLVLHVRDALQDVNGAVSAVTYLLKNVGVHTIIGPQTTDHVNSVIELGRKAHVPIISFSQTSTCISRDQSHHFIRAAQNDSSQVKAITAIFQGFAWQKVVLIYEDKHYCQGIITHLTDALEEIDVQVAYKKAIPTSSKDFQIMRELKRIKAMKNNIILVHMTTTTLGSRLFNTANKAGMMREGYAWLITDGLSNSLHEMNAFSIDEMEGVLGLRPHIPKSVQLETFKFRWNTLFPSMKPNSRVTELNIYGLWAYDTVWALAMAVERIGLVETRFPRLKHGETARDMENIGKSKIGPKILQEMLNTKLKGLSGDFQLLDGNLQPSSAFEILNVVGKGERIIGYWTLDRGISRVLGLSGEGVPYSTNTNELKKIIWPGDSVKKPVDWVTPTIKKNLLAKYSHGKRFHQLRESKPS